MQSNTITFSNFALPKLSITPVRHKYKNNILISW